MNPLWLLLIVPVTVFVSVFVTLVVVGWIQSKTYPDSDFI